MIIAITDRHILPPKTTFEEQLNNLLSSDVDYLVFREKDWPLESKKAFLEKVMKASEKHWHKVILHSDEWLALSLGIDKVHLGEKDLYRAKNKNIHYSSSVHGLDQIKTTREYPWLFQLIAPVAVTTCKPDASPLEANVLKEALAHANGPLVALGGINKANAQTFYQMGFRHLALRSSLMANEDLKPLIQSFRAMGF